MAAGAQKAGKQGSCFPTCFHFSSIFGKQKQNKKKKKKPREQIDPRVSSTPEYSEDRLRGKTWTVNSRWFNFKPDKSGRKRPPADPINTQKLEGHGIGGTDLEKANITAAVRKNFGSSNSGVGHHVSGNPQARPAVKTLPTPTAHQRQQEATFRPSSSDQSHATREIEAETTAPERQVHVTCSGDPSPAPSGAPNRQMPRKCLLSPDFSRNPVNTSARNKPVGEHGALTGMSIALVSLTSLLLCGRLCSIFWTGACLCLIPLLRKREITAHGRARVDMDSEEYRKRVIMEGILERNHKN